MVRVEFASETDIIDLKTQTGIGYAACAMCLILISPLILSWF